MGGSNTIAQLGAMAKSTHSTRVATEFFAFAAEHPIKESGRGSGGLALFCWRMPVELEETALPGVSVIVPRRFGDARGWFSETWNRAQMAEAGLACDFVQDNHSYSADAGTLRGLHYQAPPHAQTKLVRCSRGAVFDVAVDARRGAPTFGQWVGVELSAANGKQMLVPEGFLHGFLTLSPDSEVQYKVSHIYAPESDGAVRWDSLGIDWGISHPPVLSDKDAQAPAFNDWASPFTWEGVE